MNLSHLAEIHRQIDQDGLVEHYQEAVEQFRDEFKEVKVAYKNATYREIVLAFCKANPSMGRKATVILDWAKDKYRVMSNRVHGGRELNLGSLKVVVSNMQKWGEIPEVEPEAKISAHKAATTVKPAMMAVPVVVPVKPPEPDPMTFTADEIIEMREAAERIGAEKIRKILEVLGL
jgi:hypothetical protein